MNLGFENKADQMTEEKKKLLLGRRKKQRLVKISVFQ